MLTSFEIQMHALMEVIKDIFNMICYSLLLKMLIWFLIKVHTGNFVQCNNALSTMLFSTHKDAIRGKDSSKAKTIKKNKQVTKAE